MKYSLKILLCVAIIVCLHGTVACREDINDSKYAFRVGETVSVHVLPVEYFQKGNGPHQLNIGGRFPNQSFSIVFWDKSLKKSFPNSFHPQQLVNTSFSVTGKVSDYKGRLQIVVFSPDQVDGVPELRKSSLDSISEDPKARQFELLFNSPIGARLTSSTQSVIGKGLLRTIDSSKKSLDMAVYGFRNQPEIFEALQRAKERGVRIRLITDRTTKDKNYYSSTEEFEDLVGNVKTDLQADLDTASIKQNTFDPFWPAPKGFLGPPQALGYTISYDKAIVAVHASKDKFPFTGDIMHNKFVISDNQRVWTGSCNLSDSGTGGYNANIACIITSKAISSQFSREFELMYTEGRFHRSKNEEIRWKQRFQDFEATIISGQRKLYLGFCPQNYVVQNYLSPAIRNARETIDIAIFYLTHKYITADLIDAHHRGVKVRIIIDATSASNGYSKHKILREIGIPVKVENWGGKMHMKACCIDGEKLVLGSMNWTSAGERNNDENFLLLESQPEAQSYSRFFNELWESIPECCLVDDPDPESLASPGSTTDGVDNDFDKLVDDKDPGAFQELYNSKETPPHGYAKVSSGYGHVGGERLPLILGLQSGDEKVYVLPNHRQYYSLREQSECFFPSIWEAKEAGFWRNINVRTDAQGGYHFHKKPEPKPSILPQSNLEVKVLSVVDGDTLKINYKGQKESVRLIGIDTPERRNNKKTKKDAKKNGQDIETIIAMGKRAIAYVESLVKPGDTITIELDVQERDRYERLLCYVYLSNGKMLNEEIVKAGYANAMTIPPDVKYKDKFIRAYNQARKDKRGLWKE